MKIAIMQPYFLPYIGYWQLIKEVDLFIILDDVNYIKRGWINKNRISCNGVIQNITLPVSKASSRVHINTLSFVDDQTVYDNLMKTVRYAYRDAEFHEQGEKLLERILSYDDKNISKFLGNQLRVVCDYLDIKTPIVSASDMRSDVHEKAQDGILELCRIAKAEEYVNPIGGQELYDRNSFAKEMIDLYFISTDFSEIEKLSCRENMDLSILDLIMNFQKQDIQYMLEKYHLI